VILVYKVSVRGLRSGEKPTSDEHAAAIRQSRLETVKSYYGYLKRVKYQEGKLMEHLPVWIVGLQNDLRDGGVVSSRGVSLLEPWAASLWSVRQRADVKVLRHVC
jgi:hypothetical protein